MKEEPRGVNIFAKWRDSEETKGQNDRLGKNILHFFSNTPCQANWADISKNRITFAEKKKVRKKGCNSSALASNKWASLKKESSFPSWKGERPRIRGHISSNPI